jgi:hypothetical protein
MNLDLSGKPKSDNRTLAIVLAVAAAGLLLFAAFSKSWVGRPAPLEIGFGPLGCHNCALFAGEGGGDMSNFAFIETLRDKASEMWGSDEQAHASAAFAPMGMVTFVVLLLSGLGLLAAAGLAAKKVRRDLPIAPTTIALLGLMASLLTACVFVATKPGGPGFVGVSMGFWCYGIGAVLGIASAQMLAKLLRPVDPDLLDGAMSPDQY